ncbi:MAG: hypothetical protein V4656_07725 [Pseudomonadota bacterium]
MRVEHPVIGYADAVIDSSQRFAAHRAGYRGLKVTWRGPKGYADWTSLSNSGA